jgi:dihydrofolate reductase
MAIVRMHVTMSLDGFIAGPRHEMDWVFSTAGPDRQPAPEAKETMLATGAILCGRHGYDVGHQPDQHSSARKPYGGAWEGPIFVLSHEPVDDPEVTFLSGDIGKAVDTALEAADGKDLLVLGGTVGRQCQQAGLLDEIVVHINPVLLGQGISLFPHDGPPVQLHLVSQSRAGHVPVLRYAVPR